MKVFCDFDGTISLSDTTDVILARFASPAWEMIEEEWKRGEIGSAECMRLQIALIRASRQELDDVLDSLPIDPSFLPFVSFCESLGAPLTIISDGVDYFIHRILKRYQLDHLPIIANRLTLRSDGTYSLSCPYTNPSCSSASGVCKCHQIDASASTSVFVGDGRSDFCAAESADLLFAKSTLATYCIQKNISYIPYRDFADVQRAIRRVLPGIVQRQPRAEPYTFA